MKSMRSDTDILNGIIKYGLRAVRWADTQPYTVAANERIISPRRMDPREALNFALDWCEADRQKREELDLQIAQELLKA